MILWYPPFRPPAALLFSPLIFLCNFFTAINIIITTASSPSSRWFSPPSSLVPASVDDESWAKGEGGCEKQQFWKKMICTPKQRKITYPDRRKIPKSWWLSQRRALCGESLVRLHHRPFRRDKFASWGDDKAGAQALAAQGQFYLFCFWGCYHVCSCHGCGAGAFVLVHSCFCTGQRMALGF